MVSRLAALALILASATAHADSGQVVIQTADPANYDRAAVAREFYATHADEYDFLAVFTTFDTDVLTVEPGAVGLNTPVRNHVDGIGLPAYDDPAFGSTGRLKSYVDLASLEPSSPSLSVGDSEGIVAHEILHQFAAHIGFVDATTGQTSSTLLGRLGAHWSFFLDTNGSVLYGSHWMSPDGGAWVSVESRKRYSDLDLYLMGMIGPEEVGPLTLLEPAPQTPFQAVDTPPADGTVISATRHAVTVDEITAAMGPRVPSVDQAQHDFRVAFLLVVPSGDTPTPEQVTYVDRVRTQWENDFFFLSHGRGTMDTTLVDVPPSSLALNPSIDLGLNWLLAAQEPDGGWSDAPATEVRDTEAALEALSLFSSDPRMPLSTAAGAEVLLAHSPRSTDEAARRILGLLAAHRDTSSAWTGLSQFPTAPFGDANGRGLASGYGSTVLDTALRGMACVRDNPSACDPQLLASYFETTQGASGGWPLTEGGPPSLLGTSVVLELLSRLPATAQTRALADQGCSYLLSMREHDGSFSDDGEAAGASAEALLALIRWQALSGSDVALSTASLLRAQRTDGSWDEGRYATARALSALRVSMLPNLVVAPNDVVLTSASVVEGRPATAMVSVHNLGFQVATGVQVQAFDSEGVPFGPPVAVPDVAPDNAPVVMLPLDTSGHAGSTQLFIVVDPAGTVGESERGDNRVAVSLEVLPPPVAPDLFVTASSLSATPAIVTQRPMSISLSATVGDLGTTPAPGTVIALLADGVQIGSTTVDLAATASATFSVQGTVPAGSQDVRFTIVVDPASEVPDPDRSNNSAALTVAYQPVPDLAISYFSIYPNATSQGQLVEGSVWVANHSQATVQAASAVITLRDLTGAVVKTVTPPPIALSPGGTNHASFAFDAESAGSFTVSADVNFPGDPNPADNHAEQQLLVAPSSGINLVAHSADVTYQPSPAVEHQNLTVSAMVENDGDSDSQAFFVDLWLGDSTQGGVQFVHQLVPGLAAGASTQVVGSAPVGGPAASSIQVDVDPDDAISEFDESDNLTIVPLAVTRVADLAISGGDISVSPEFPSAGQVAIVSAKVSNLGGQQAAPAAVELYLGDPSQGGVSIGSASTPALDPAQSTTVTFDFDTTGLNGSQELFVRVNADGAVDEAPLTNDVASREVSLQSGAITVSEPYFSPNGDGIKDFTHILSSGTGTATLSIADATGSLVRISRGDPSAPGGLTWDGHDDGGRVVPDGKYGLTIVGSADGGSYRLGPAYSTVDTNAAQVLDAFGTPDWYQDQIDSSFDLEFEPVPLPDDRGVVFYADYRPPGCVPTWGNYCDEDGIYEVDWRDNSIRALTPPDWESTQDILYQPPVVSPDGSKVIYLAYDYASQFREYAYVIQAVDVAHQSYAPVMFFDPNGRDWEWDTSLEFSPDGRRIFFATDDWSTATRSIESVSVDGSDRRTILTLPYPREVSSYAVSRDGAHIAVATDDGSLYVVAADGSQVSAGAVLPDHSVRWRWSDTLVSPQNLTWLDSHRVAYLGATWITYSGGEGSPGISHGTEKLAVYDLVSSRTTDLYLPPTGTSFSGAMSADPTGKRLLVAARSHTSNTTIAFIDVVDTDSGTPRVLGVPASNETEALVSPRGTFIIPGASLHDTVMYRTFANLTAGLAVTRPDNGNEISFQGVATDINFARWSLQVVQRGSGATYQLASGTSPVRRGELARWLPPEAATYDATLTVEDLAGNSIQRSMPFVWTNSPLISNVTETPQYISPNGDGIQDRALVSFDLAAPDTVELGVTDAVGGAVDTIGETFIDGGHSAIAWDGLEAAGGVAPDGTYSLGLGSTRFSVVVDNTLPQLVAMVGFPDAGVVDGGVGLEYAYGSMDALCFTEDPDAGLARLGWPFNPATNRPEQPPWIPEAFLRLRGELTEQNPKNWFLEENTFASRDDFSPVATWDDTEPKNVSLPVDGLGGPQHRFKAADLAGNVSYSATLANDPALFVTGVSPIDVTAGGLASRSFCSIDGMRTAPWGLFWPVRLDTDVDPHGVASAPTFQSVGTWSFGIENTEGESLASVDVDLGDGDGGFLPQTSTHTALLHGDVLTWNSSGLRPNVDYVLRFRGTTFSGRALSQLLNVKVVPSVQDLVVAGLEDESGRTFNGYFRVPRDSPLVGAASVGISVYPALNPDGGAPATVEERIPLSWTASGYDALGHFAIDDSMWPDCNNQVKFHDAWTLDGRVIPSFPTCGAGPCASPATHFVNTCAMFDEGFGAAADGQLTTALATTYKSPFASVDVFAVAISDGHVDAPRQGTAESPCQPSGDHGNYYLGSVGGFDVSHHSSFFPVDLTGLPACTTFRFRFEVSGAPQDAQDFPDRSSLFCPVSNGFELDPFTYHEQFFQTPCAGIAVGPVARTGGDGICGPNSFAGWRIPIAISGGNVTSITATVKNWDGSVDEPLDLSDIALGTDARATAEVSSSGLPDGNYRVFVEAPTADAGVIFGESDAFAVDHVSPQLTIESPNGNGFTCPVQRLGFDGVVHREVDVTGYLHDTNPESASVVLTGADGGSLFSGGLNYSSSPGSRLGDVDVSELPSGAYVLSANAIDSNGNSACAASTLNLVAAAQWSGMAAHPPVFSPDGDGVADSTAISADVDQQVSIAASVDGVPLASMNSDQNVGLTWNGYSGASRLADGIHIIEFDATNACGEVSRTSVPVEIDTAAPLVAISAPAPGQSEQASFVVEGEASDKNLQSWNLELGAGAAPLAWTSVASGTSAAHGALGTVATSGLSQGTYTLRLGATDTVGHASHTSLTFQFVAGRVIADVGVQPALISPNSDGVLDDATAVVNLLQPATVSLDLVGADGSLVASLIGPTELPSGASTLPIGAYLFAGVPDGDDRVRATAVAGTTTETGLASLALDRLAPDASVETPADGSCIAGDTVVQVAVSDSHLSSWRLDETAGSSTGTLASGADPVSQTIADLSNLPDGTYKLTLHASDWAGNGTTRTSNFTSDTRAPRVTVTAPSGGAYVSARQGPVVVSANVSDANLSSISLSRSSASGSTTIAQLAAPLAPGPVAEWNLSGESDGPAELELSATDCAGNSTTSKVQLTIDSTAPVAHLDSPRSGTLPPDGAVVGTASDANLTSWSLAIAPEVGGPLTFVTIASGTSEVTGGLLTALQPLPASGTYRARLTVVDAAGNTTVDEAEFTVDTVPPGPPAALTAVVQNRSDVALAWTAPPDADVVGYWIYRGQSGASAVRVNTAPVRTTSYVDVGVADGTWAYAVSAVDAAAVEGSRSNTAEVMIDRLSPLTSIIQPASGESVSGAVAVTGFASSPDFKEYRLYVGSGTSPGSYTLLVRSSAQVQAGELGTVDTTRMPQGSQQTLRLETEDVSGNVGVAQTTFTVDNVQPSRPVLTGISASGSDVSVTWQANPESDVIGYLLYRNGVLANSPEAADLSDPRPYVMTSLGFTDPDVVDGTQTYRLQAVDSALNLSDLSDPLSVDIDTHPPHLSIDSPPGLSRQRTAFAVTASSPDIDVALVQFEFRTDPNSEFEDLGTALSSAPFVAAFDPSGTDAGLVQVTAVATDAHGNADSNPPTSVYVTEPQIAAPSVQAHVDGDTVSLAWSVPDGVRPFGFSIDRDGAPVLPDGGMPAGTAGATSGWNISQAYDGNLYSQGWTPTDPAPQTWELDLASPVLIDGLGLSLYSSNAVTVSARVGGFWATIDSIQRAYAYNTTITQIAPVVVDAIRVTFPSYDVSWSPPSLNELILHTVQTTQGAAYTDLSVPVGAHVYGVSPHTVGGTTSRAVAAARVYAPVLVAAVSASGVSGVPFAGSNATPGATVTISGGVQDVTVQADDGGAFSGTATLAPGINALVAQAVDAQGNRSLPSAPVSVVFDPAPATAPALTLEGVAGAQVSLSWTDDDPTGVNGFEVDRDGNAVATLPLSQTNYVDEAPNGSHTYVVLPLNADALAGPGSNAVTAEVQVAPPDAPVLAVAPAPAGMELDLAWSEDGSTAVDFQVERSGSESGPFQTLASGVTALAYADTGLADGTTWYYRVESRDALGNLGPPSNVVGATVADIEPPGAPALTDPTSPGSPITVSVPSIDISGLSDPGSRVELFQNGLSLGSRPADGFGLGRAPLPTTYPVGATAAAPAFTSPVCAPPAFPLPPGLALSPDGEVASYTTAPADGSPSELVAERPNHAPELLAAPGVDLFGQPIFSPDGARVALEGVSRADACVHIYVADVRAGTVSKAVANPQAQGLAPAWSADGTRLAYESLSNDGGARSLGIATLTTGSEQVVQLAWGYGSRFSVHTPAWAGSSVVALLQPTQYDSPTLARIDPSTGEVSEVVASQSLVAFALSHSGTTAVTVSDLGWGTALSILDMSNGASIPLAESLLHADSPVFAPDDSRIAILDGTDLWTADPSTGAASRQLTASAGTLAWPTANALVLTPSVGPPGLVRRMGRFTFIGVPLAAGPDEFAARASDASGNTGPFSLPIDVNFDSSMLADLGVSVSVEPTPAVAGEAANGYVTVTNRGSATAISPTLEVVLATSGGEFRTITSASLGVDLDPGASHTSTVPLDLTGLSGTQTLYGVVDPSAVIPDPNRADNHASTTFDVLAHAGISLSLALSPSTLGPSALGAASVQALNAGPDVPATLALSLEDAAGNVVAPLASQTYSPLPGFVTTSLRADVPSGRILAGAYQVVATAEVDGGEVARANAPLTVLGQTSATVSLAADQGAYQPDRPIGFSVAVENTSPNVVLSGAEIELSIQDEAGAKVASGQLSVPPLALDSAANLAWSVPAGTLPSGIFQAHANLVLAGAVIASADAQVQVISQPLLGGTLVIPGATGSPPAVRESSTLNLEADLVNSGNAPANDIALSVELIDPSSAGVLATSSAAIGSLGAGRSATSELSLDTQAVTPGVYTLVLQAAHDSQPSAVLAQHQIQIVDGQPPVLTFVAPSNGAYVGGSVAIRVHAIDIGSGTVQVWVSVDGASAAPLQQASGNGIDGEWTGVLAGLADGAHRLDAWAVDLAGNDGSGLGAAADGISTSVISDSTPPVIHISGVSNGELSSSPVVPTIQVTDASPVSVTPKLDSQAYAAGTPIGTDGDHALLVEASDAAGNAAAALVHFSIDPSPPVIQVTGVVDGEVRAGAVTPIVTILDPHLSTSSISLDAAPFISGMAVRAEGPHRLQIQASDSLGHTANASLGFTIDTTPPQVSLGGFVDGAYLNHPVTPTWSAIDADLQSVAGTLNGNPANSGTTITADGSYSVVVTARDSAGLTATSSGSFTIDTAKPAITLAPPDGTCSDLGITPHATFEDPHLASTSETMNGSAWADGSALSADGTYLFASAATDLAGNDASAQARYVVDTTAPAVAIGGLDAGVVGPDPDAGLYFRTPVTPTVSVVEPNLVSQTLTLDGQPYDGGTISDEGAWTVFARATDCAGHYGDAVARLIIDETPPAIALGGFTDGEVVRGPVAPTFSISDSSPYTYDAELDDSRFWSGGAVYADGVHEIVVTATDLPGNDSQVRGSFTIDTQAPQITIAGVSDGETSSTPVAPVYTVVDANLAWVQASLDGSAFTSGVTVGDPGSHTLTVEAADLAGNTAALTVSFEIVVVTLDGGAATQPRVLVDQGCSSGSPCPALPVLEAALQQAGFSWDYAPTDARFLELLRENRYRAYVLHAPDKQDSAVVSELAEHVYEGEGLVYIKNGPPEDPAMRALVGGQTQGKARGVSAIDVQGIGSIPIAGDVIELAPTTATPFATAQAAGRRAVVVATRQVLGTGEVTYLSFDPELAPGQAMTTELASILQDAAANPATGAEPLAVVDALASVNNPGTAPQSIRLSATLPPDASLLDASPALTQTAPQPAWLWNVSAESTAFFHLWLRLPDLAATEAIGLQLELGSNGSFAPVQGASVSYVVGTDGAGMLAKARADLQALAVTGADATLRTAALSALAGITGAPGSLAAADADISDVLAAVQQVQGIAGADTGAARASLDALLRYEENAYSSLRGWP